MEKKKISDDDLGEDKRDFELLKRQISELSIDSVSNSTTSTDSQIWPLRLNTSFVEHYIIGDLIGTGAYAEVRECVDTRTLERCAMKIINKNYLRRRAPRALSNQLQEIRLLKQLRHTNVIELKEFLTIGPRCYIVLEYCTYVLSSLLDDQKDKRLCVSLTRNLFHQTCLGISYLHSLGIVHRDIKPHNLLITNSGIIKIIDFGVSQILSIWDRNDTCSNYEGSPLFQAPEVVCGQSEYAGCKVDVWSAGVTLYLMLFGVYPFFDESLLGLYDKILSDDLKLPDKENSPYRLTQMELIGMMLDKVSSRRATIDQVLEHSWLKLDHSIHCDEETEFVDIVTSRKPGDGHTQQRDIYRSMTVLPYLHNHHFPNFSVMKPKQPRSASISPSQKNQDNGSEISTTDPDLLRPSSTSSNYSTSSDSSTMLNNPHEIIDDNPVEWGTEKQFNLLKMPIIRANRIKPERRKRKPKKFRYGQ